MKILLLEDNITLNKTICLKLNKQGHEIRSFVDGKEALSDITEGFSCFILDINVPNVNGIEILKEVRRFYEDTPIIIISSNTKLEYIKKSYDFGCSDYIKKPFFIDELEYKIDKLCIRDNKTISIDKDLSFNFKEALLIVGGLQKKLSPKESLLLNILLKNKNYLVSYTTIQNYVWEGDYASIDAIRSLIRRLKKLLEKPYIRSFTNRGYSFKEMS